MVTFYLDSGIVAVVSLTRNGLTENTPAFIFECD